MSGCKLCQNGISEAMKHDLTQLSSRAFAAKYTNIGKTTVNKHKNKCMTNTVIETELPEVIWAGETGEIRTGNLSSELDRNSPEDILRMFGHDPDEVEITTVLWEKHRQYWSRDLEQMLWKHSYSFGVARKKTTNNENIDAIGLIKELGIQSVPQKPFAGTGTKSTWVLDWADWQVHKAEGGGAQGFIERFDSAMQSALLRVAELRSIGRNLEELVIIGGGDIVEGCVIYPQQSFHIDGHRRDQVKLAVATILKGLYTLAPHFKTVRVMAVPGNHGEHRINGNRTAIGDNDDLLVFEMAQVGIQNDPNMKHVSFEIAENEISMTTDILGWKYGATHGDVYGRSGGSGIRNKVFNWVRTMAANRHPVGLVDVLVTHHYHHDALEDWGSMLWVQNPTMDGGSHYYKEATGHYAKWGMNSWVVTQSERFQDKQILR